MKKIFTHIPTFTKTCHTFLFLLINLIASSAWAASSSSCSPTLSISSSSTIPCSPITYTASPVGSGGTTTFKWHRNNYLVGTNSSVFTDSLPRYNDSVWVEMTTAPCGTRITLTSAKIHVLGVSTTPPTISISVNSTAISPTSNPIFTASSTNSGYRPLYTWYVNGNAVPNLHNSVMSYGGDLGNGDQINATVELTSCGTPLMGTSNTLVMTEAGSSANEILSFRLPNQIGNTSIDSVASTVVVTSPSGNSKVMHPSRITVSPGASYGPSMYVVQDFSSPVVYTVRAQNGQPKVWTVYTIDSCTPLVTVTADHNTPCSAITFTAHVTNAGSSQSFQWYVNHTPVGSNSTTYVNNSPNFNDSVYVVMTSHPCGSVRSDESRKIYIDGLGASGDAIVRITANSTNLDTNHSPTFTATSSNAGTNPVYTWYLNGTVIGMIHNPTLSYGGRLGNDDHIWASVTTTQCGGSVTTYSDTLILTKSGSNAKNITFFTMPGQIGSSVIDSVNATITATVPAGSRTAMHPSELLVSPNASYGPSISVVRDFSHPVTYTVIAQNGSAKVWTITVTDPNGFKTDNDATSALDDQAQIADDFNAYPNPARTYLDVTIAASDDPTSITVVGLDGRVMYTGQLPATTTPVTHMVSVADYAAGIYIIHVRSGEKLNTLKITVER